MPSNEIHAPTVVELEVAKGIVVRGVRDAERMQLTMEKQASDEVTEPEVLTSWTSYFASEMASVRVLRQGAHAFLSAGAVSFALPAEHAGDFATQLGLPFQEK